jgi:glycosyltransferase involved in cell wall biosynthesis
MQPILFDCTPSLFPSNGVGRVTRALLNALLKQMDPKDFILYNRSLRKKIQGFPNSKKFRIPFPKVLEQLIKKLGLLDRLAKDVSLFHATDHYMPLENCEKAIVTVHDIIFLKRPEKHLSKLHKDMAKRVPPLLKKCLHIITCSEYTKKDLVEHLNIPADKVTVITWGLNHELFKPSEDPKMTEISLARKFGITSKYFLAVSCSTGRKNTPMLLNCYEDLLRKNPTNDLVLLWDAPEEIRQRYNHPKIHFTKKVDDESLRDLYRCATATVYPSLYEGFGLPVLESMSCGTPVICSDVTSLPEVGGNASLYINPLDAESLSQQMLKFERNELDIEKMIKDGLKHASNFTWEECAKQTINVYKRFQK